MTLIRTAMGKGCVETCRSREHADTIRANDPHQMRARRIQHALFERATGLVARVTKSRGHDNGALRAPRAKIRDQSWDRCRWRANDGEIRHIR